jgi:predicted secreted protein
MAEIEVQSSGEHVEATTGDRIVIRIPENATTGFRWQLTDVTALVDVVEDELEPPTSAAPGAGATRRVTLLAREAGEGHAELALVQPWEGKAADRFELSFTVS